MSGPYGREAYVRSLAPAASEPEPLWGGHVLLRPSPHGVGVDAASAYPLGGFDAAADPATSLGLLAAAGSVALVVVPDPLIAPAHDRVGSAAAVLRPLQVAERAGRAGGV